MRCKFARLLALCLSSLFFQSCFEPVEGCLDTSATNFEATADNDCCCIYPNLILDVEQYFGGDSVVFLNDRWYRLGTGDSLRFKSIVFYLADFQLFQNGTWLPVADTARLRTYPDSVEQKFTDDFLLIRRTPGSYTVGEFRTEGNFTELKFSLGLGDAANKIIPALAPANHPLRPQAERLWLENQGFALARIVFERDTATATPPDTLAFFPPGFSKIDMAFPGSFAHKSGYDFHLKLLVDFRQWFEGVDLSDDDIQTIKNKVGANLPNGFAVSQ